MPKKLIPLPKLKKKAWKLISIYVRKGASDWKGYTACYTCYIQKPWQELDCGHFIHNKLDYDLRNLKAQCRRCNHFLRGNLGVYAENLVRTYGLEWLEELRKYSYEKGNNYTRQELEEVIQKYGKV